MSQDRRSGTATSASKWAAPGLISISAPGICSASHWVCATGEKTSFSPCQSRTGTLMAVRSNPQGAQKARTSSIQPSGDPLSASL
jgi:hypothetical protein